MFVVGNNPHAVAELQHGVGSGHEVHVAAAHPGDEHALQAGLELPDGFTGNGGGRDEDAAEVEVFVVDWVVAGQGFADKFGGLVHFFGGAHHRDDIAGFYSVVRFGQEEFPVVFDAGHDDFQVEPERHTGDGRQVLFGHLDAVSFEFLQGDAGIFGLCIVVDFEDLRQDRHGKNDPEHTDGVSERVGDHGHF